MEVVFLLAEPWCSNQTECGHEEGCTCPSPCAVGNGPWSSLLVWLLQLCRKSIDQFVCRMCHTGTSSLCGWLTPFAIHEELPSLEGMGGSVWMTYKSSTIIVLCHPHGSLQLVYLSLNGQRTGLWTSQNRLEKTYRAGKVRQGRSTKCYGKWELLLQLPFKAMTILHHHPASPVTFC